VAFGASPEGWPSTRREANRTSSASTRRSSRASARSPRGRTRSGSSSPTSAAASQRAGRVTLFVDGKETGPGHFERTQPFPFSGDEAFDLGSEFSSLVTTDYGQREFSGQVTWAEIELGLGDHDHLISPEERLNLAVAIQ
jgi:hypothetical protein